MKRVAIFVIDILREGPPEDHPTLSERHRGKNFLDLLLAKKKRRRTERFLCTIFRTIKSSRSSLESLMVSYDTFFF